MLRTEEIQRLAGHDVYDRNDDKIGTAGQIFVDTDTRQPEWLSVKTGLFGKKESFVPVSDAEVTGDALHVPFEKAQVKDAPNIDPAAEGITPDEEQQLYSYYRELGWQPPQQGGRPGAEESAERGRESRDDAMTRSEEQLRVGKEKAETGRARLRKHVTTEQQQVTVPVQREEVRVEREPITEANREAATAGPDITESEHEVTLQAERPVVGKETVPQERVRLGKEAVTEEKTVGGEVRKEHIEEELPEQERTKRH
jgi:uncharacterized protein (TIGR02271 family)